MDNSTIWTDNETARDLIWRSYIGFKENYENYLMYWKSYGVKHKVYKGGLWRYAISLYEEIRPLLEKFKIENEDLVEEILDSDSLFNDNNLRIVIRFFNDFLYVSGMKNIVFKKDVRSGLQKVSDLYELKQ